MSNNITKLYTPSKNRIESSQINHFMREAGFNNYSDLHQWTISKPEEFWPDLFGFFNLKYNGNLSPAFNDITFKDYSWFPNVELNFAENLLKCDSSEKVAINFVHESGLNKKISYSELRSQTASMADYIKSYISEGDVLAAYMPHIPETIISMLAVTSLGGVFTSTSSDFGVKGVIERLSQSKPAVLVAACGYEYNGKYYDCLEKIKSIVDHIPTLKKVILVDFLKKSPSTVDIDKSILWNTAMEVSKCNELTFKRVKFNSPVYILYSSGTTGKPKCIVHCVGGVLLQHVKELGLHCDLTEDKNIFYFTTCGWMMWNWLISSLALNATITIYEGSPAYPDINYFFDIINREKINIFGTSAKFLKALEDSEKEPTNKYPTLETILSTGSPLLPEQFDFVYEKIKQEVQLSSISGGTDIVSCFVLGNPILPIYRGEIQCIGLGMDVSCCNEDGSELINTKGELTCKKSFPSRPTHFLSDPTGEKINNAYFNTIPGLWCHGDFITITDRETVIIHGRSDTTLNPGGVRIGTAEIYRQVELFDYIEDSLCIGQQINGDVNVILFVKLKAGEQFDDNKVKEIKSAILKNTTSRHVPANIYQVNDIPYTRSGKKMELPVTRLLSNIKVDNIEAVANPECLAEYEQYKI